MHNTRNGSEDAEDHCNSSPVIPKNTVPFEYQVAGHFDLQNLGLLRDCLTGHVLKPLHQDKRGEREVWFYSLVWDNRNDDDAAIVRLRQFIPQFHGVVHDREIRYLQMSNLTSAFSWPSIMDIKIGCKTYDPDADLEKIRSEVNKYPWLNQLGFRILGMKIYQQNENKYLVKDKNYGKGLRPDQIETALRLFVNNDVTVIISFLNQLNAIKSWFDDDNVGRWLFLASSLLFVSGENTSPVVKMIDFAHVFPNKANVRDDNYLFGLNKLIEYFDKLKDLL